MKAVLAIAALSIASLPLSAGTLRVRLWSQHPPARLHVTSAAHAEWRACAGCRAHAVQSLELQAKGAKLETAGSSSASILLDGSYELMADAVAVHLDWPTEIHAAGGRLIVILTIPLEDYVAAVVTGEAGGITQPEALNAMAVAARTYAVHFRGRHSARGYDLCDSTHCQDLRLAVSSPRSRDAALRTEGELLWFRGTPAATYYHRSCGGATEDGTIFQPGHSTAPPYLRSHADPYCVRNSADEWRGEAGKHELGEALRRAGLPVTGDLQSVAVTSRSNTGRVQTLRLESGHAVAVPSVAFRFAVGRTLGWQVIRSEAYQITDLGDRLAFFGRGQGHGVGLCQTGAAVMASEGHSYREILAFYYPGTQLGINAQGLRWTLLSGERLEMLTTDPAQDRQWMEPATRALRRIEQRAGWTATQTPQLRIFPTVAAFRDSTGEPGWVAASTRGRTIRLQPPHLLRLAGTLDSTLAHEFAHFLFETRARPGLPLWFREGLVMWIAGEPRPAPSNTLSPEDLEHRLRAPLSQQELRHTYAEAHARVNSLIDRYGAATVMGWVEKRGNAPF
jgi:stage II sporulation protein D